MMEHLTKRGKSKLVQRCDYLRVRQAQLAGPPSEEEVKVLCMKEPRHVKERIVSSSESRSLASEGKPKRKQVPTIRHVAEAAGVSTAAVSKFINRGQRFTPEVEARIAQAIQQLGYSSNPLARGMITGRTGNVGIVILDIRNPHFTSVVKGASRAALAAGVNLIFADAAESREPELAVLRALHRQVDGLIVSARTPPPAIDWLTSTEMPVVYFGGKPERPGLHSVGCDHEAAGFMLGCHLRDTGHRKIGYVGFGAARWSHERLKGLQKAFAGTTAQFQVFDVPAPVAEEGERIASAVLLNAHPLDAVVTFNDLLALGLLNQAIALGVPIPQQISLAGFDNIVYGRYVTPSLTTVDQDSELLGETAMKRLVQLVSSAEAVRPAHILIPTRVVVRQSTARAGTARASTGKRAAAKT